MDFPQDRKYTKDHEWIKIEEGSTAIIGITNFAQSELGDIVYVDISTVGKAIAAQEVFGTVEAVKTVSDLFLPVDATILEVNPDLEKSPELVNKDPYGEGWMAKILLNNISDLESLLDATAYQNLVG